MKRVRLIDRVEADEEGVHLRLQRWQLLARLAADAIPARDGQESAGEGAVRATVPGGGVKGKPERSGRSS